MCRVEGHTLGQNFRVHIQIEQTRDLKEENHDDLLRHGHISAMDLRVRDLNVQIEKIKADQKNFIERFSLFSQEEKYIQNTCFVQNKSVSWSHMLSPTDCVTCLTRLYVCVCVRELACVFPCLVQGREVVSDARRDQYARTSLQHHATVSNGGAYLRQHIIFALLFNVKESCVTRVSSP